MRIPKIIYSTWINPDPLPNRFFKYIESWKYYLPDYDIRFITLDNTPRSEFIDHFIKVEKYAVAAQYARCHRVYETGGLYFDIDIEVIRSFDELLQYEMFAGIESDNIDHYVNNAIFGASKGNPFMSECMEYMNKIDKELDNIEVSTGPLMFTKLMRAKGWEAANKSSNFSGNEWKDGMEDKQTPGSIQLLGSEYFYPYFYTEQFKNDCITENTYAVHHWAATWVNSVSVIIPADTADSGIERTIESALNQSMKPIEIVIVHYGKSEGLADIQAIAERFRVKVISYCNSKFHDALNEGICFAKGRWILPLDKNESLVSNFIESTIDIADIVIVPGKRNLTIFRRRTWEITGNNSGQNIEEALKEFISKAKEKGIECLESYDHQNN